jgi:hypothetical protein
MAIPPSWATWRENWTDLLGVIQVLPSLTVALLVCLDSFPDMIYTRWNLKAWCRSSLR